VSHVHLAEIVENVRLVVLAEAVVVLLHHLVEPSHGQFSLRGVQSAAENKTKYPA
jgi:hypothetical protein